jgi:hypothetical protein
VAVEDVFDTLGISDIEVLTRSEVRRVVAAPGELQALIDQLPAEPSHSPPPPPEAAPSEPQEPPSLDAVDPPGPPFPPSSPEIFTDEVLPPPPPVPVPQADVTPPERDEGLLDPPAEPEEDPLIPSDEPAGILGSDEPEEESPEPVVPSDNQLADLVAELRALRETASRADALAVSVGNRIELLEGAEERADRLEREQREREERISQLERDLAAALATTAELEGKLSGVADAAEELNAATETLRGLQRALEQSAR